MVLPDRPWRLAHDPGPLLGKCPSRQRQRCPHPLHPRQLASCLCKSAPQLKRRTNSFKVFCNSTRIKLVWRLAVLLNIHFQGKSVVIPTKETPLRNRKRKDKSLSPAGFNPMTSRVYAYDLQSRNKHCPQLKGILL